MEKARRRLEMEKQELSAALEEAESALENEEAKVSRAQLEIAVIRQEIDRRISEKDEEFENTRWVVENTCKHCSHILIYHRKLFLPSSLLILISLVLKLEKKLWLN